MQSRESGCRASLLTLGLALATSVAPSGCLGLPPRVEPRPPAAIARPAADELLHAQVDLATLRLQLRAASGRREPPTCPVAEPTSPYARRFEYRLEDAVLRPLPHGPRIREQPRPGRPRRSGTITAALHSRQAELVACYRFTLVKEPGLEGQLPLRLQVDDAGRLIVRPLPPGLGTGQLAGCVTDVLTQIDLRSYTPRTTELDGVLVFKRSGSMRPPTSASPPVRPRRARPGSVRPAGRRLPVDRLTEPTALLEIGDYVQAIYEAEQRAAYRARLREWRRSGGRGPRPIAPVFPTFFSCGAVVVSGPRTRETLREVVGFNRGEYQRCALEALQRSRRLAGRVELSARFDACGQAREVAVVSTSFRDPLLHQCLLDASAELWLEMGDYRGGRLRFGFVLAPGQDVTVEATPTAPLGTAEHIQTWARQASARGDARQALRHWAALVGQRPSDARACRWQQGLLATLREVVPWDDNAMLTAARTLAIHAARPDASPACFDAAATALKELATGWHNRWKRTRRLEVLERARFAYEAYLGLPRPSSPTLGSEAVAPELAPAGGIQRHQPAR